MNAVAIRDADRIEDLHRLAAVFDEIWGTTCPVVRVELLRAAQHAGGCLCLAEHGGHVVGGSFGILARHRGEPALHSHVTGVLPGVRHTGVGRAIKLHQRAWAAANGLAWIVWTFDPLVRRNAWFNLGVLGARVEEYLVDFYGPIDDTVNAGDETDRLLVAWAVHDAAADAREEPPNLHRGDSRGHRRAAPDRSRGRHGVAPAAADGARRRVGRRRGGRRLHPRRRVRGWSAMSGATVRELRELTLPLVTPFRTSFGTQTTRRILLLRAEAERDGTIVDGWGECVATEEPTYSAEYVDDAALTISTQLVPRLHRDGAISASAVANTLAPVKGHPMAKAALEMAVLDAELRAEGRAFAEFLGATPNAGAERSQRRHPRLDRRAAGGGGRLPD